MRIECDFKAFCLILLNYKKMPAPELSPSKPEKKGNAKKQQQQMRDLYEVLGVGRNATEQEIKRAYRRLALRFHPDKNGDDPADADAFKEATYAYNILSDPDERRLYDKSGFEAAEPSKQELELDISSLSTVNTIFVALFSKLGVGIKTTVSATVLELASYGSVTVCPLRLGQSICRKVERQSAHFYSVEISECDTQTGIVCRAYSNDKSKFKLLYFEQAKNRGLRLALQEDSSKTGKISSAEMFFLRFPVHRIDQSRQRGNAKDPDALFFRKLDGFEPCEIYELKAGTHIFAVYGDNFFKSASYTIEIFSAAPFPEEKKRLQIVENGIKTKKTEMIKFEAEYREVFAQFTEIASRYAHEIRTIDGLLKERNSIQARYTTIPSLMRSFSINNVRSSLKGSKGELYQKTKENKWRSWTRGKKLFNLHL